MPLVFEGLLLNLNDDLSEVSTAEQIPQRLIRLFKFPYAIYDRLDLLLIIELQHSFELISWAVYDAFKRHIPLQAQEIGVRPVAFLVLLAGKVPDTSNQPTETYTLERLAQGLGAANFDDNIGTAIFCDFEDRVVPGWRIAVIDTFLNTKLLCAL